MLPEHKQNLDATGESRPLNGYDHATSDYGGLNFPITTVHHVLQKSWLLPTPVSEISGLCRTVLKHCMNSVTLTNTAVSFLAYAQGETMSMDLTEPDAGSDLQRSNAESNLQRKRRLHGRLNGVKRFITNGDCKSSTWYLARSEEGTKRRSWSFYVHL